MLNQLLAKMSPAEAREAGFDIATFAAFVEGKNARFAGAPDLGMGGLPSPWIDINQIIADGDISTGAMMTLTGAINALPFVPKYLGELGIFDYEPRATNKLAIEYDSQGASVIETTAPGSPGQETILNPRQVKTINSVRIARKVTIRATELAGIRGIASATLDTPNDRKNMKMLNAIRDMQTTLEYHRVGTVRGLLLDADATTVLQSFFTLLGVAQPTLDCTQGTAANGKWVALAETILNMLEDALGNLVNDEPPIALTGRTFWSRFVTSADILQAYQYFMTMAQAVFPGRQDLRYLDFPHGGLIWRQYRGQAANTSRFIPDTQAQIIVQGVPGTYQGHMCPPQDIDDMVNREGPPIAITVEPLPHKRGVEVEMQINPAHVHNRPLTAIELFSSN